MHSLLVFSFELRNFHRLCFLPNQSFHHHHQSIFFHLGVSPATRKFEIKKMKLGPNICIHSSNPSIQKIRIKVGHPPIPSTPPIFFFFFFSLSFGFPPSIFPQTLLPITTKGLFPFEAFFVFRSSHTKKSLYGFHLYRFDECSPGATKRAILLFSSTHLP